MCQNYHCSHQKHASRNQRQQWREWLANGQVVRVYLDATHSYERQQITGYPTVERAQAAVANAIIQGFTAEIVVTQQA